MRSEGFELLECDEAYEAFYIIRDRFKYQAAKEIKKMLDANILGEELNDFGIKKAISLIDKYVENRLELK